MTKRRNLEIDEEVDENLDEEVDENLDEIIGERKPLIQAGHVYKHPDDGRLVFVTDGKYLADNGLISNFWYWRDVNEDGSLGEKGHGYGWGADPEPMEIRVIVSKS